MKKPKLSISRFTRIVVLICSLGSVILPGIGSGRCLAAEAGASGDHRFLYVAEPGVRNYLEYGGHGLLVFDIDRGHRFVKRIPTGLDGKENRAMKGVCANATTRRIYISRLTTPRLDLVSEKSCGKLTREAECMALALDESIYLPSLEKEHWHVVTR